MQQNKSFDGLNLVSYCPLCNTHYNPKDANLLEEKDGAHLIHLQCSHCSSSIVAVIITGGLGVSSVGLITDLTGEDVIKFKNASWINEDDVIEAYKSITQGDFTSLLNE